MKIKALIKFSNGDTLKINENDLLVPIQKTSCDGKQFISEYKPVSVKAHIKFGLIPSIADIVGFCEFFRLADEPDKIYKSSAIVTIENI